MPLALRTVRIASLQVGSTLVLGSKPVPVLGSKLVLALVLGSKLVLVLVLGSRLVLVLVLGSKLVLALALGSRLVLVQGNKLVRGSRQLSS